jgi:hypothetical protein
MERLLTCLFARGHANDTTSQQGLAIKSTKKCVDHSTEADARTKGNEKKDDAHKDWEH